MRNLMIEPSRDPEEIEPQYLNRIAQFKGARVLEVGCGDGRLTWRYGQSPASILGVDPQRELLAAAHKDRPDGWQTGTHFVQAEAENLPLPLQHFDVTLLAWSL